MRVVERVGKLAKDPSGGVGRQLPVPPNAITERFPANVPHDKVGPTTVFTERVQGHDVRMGQPSRNLRLPAEPLLRRVVVEPMWTQDLERHESIEDPLTREVDLA